MLMLFKPFLQRILQRNPNKHALNISVVKIYWVAERPKECKLMKEIPIVKSIVFKVKYDTF